MTNTEVQDTRLPEELTGLNDALAWCGRRVARALVEQAEAAQFNPLAEATQVG